MNLKTTALIISLFFLSTSFAKKTEEIYFITPKNNEIVKPTFKVKFSNTGLVVKPAGEDIDNKKAGHYHIIIDSKFIPAGQMIPMDPQHIHYGKGQTEAELSLSRGVHTLTLQFADGAHRSYGEKLSQTITVNVK